MVDFSGLALLDDWRFMLSMEVFFAALSAVFIYTGFLTFKKRSKPALVFIILIFGLGAALLTVCIIDRQYDYFFNYLSAVLILVYSAVAFAVWITDNIIIKIIRIILALLIAGYTLYFTVILFLGFIAALAHALSTNA